MSNADGIPGPISLATPAGQAPVNQSSDGDIEDTVTYRPVQVDKATSVVLDHLEDPQERTYFNTKRRQELHLLLRRAAVEDSIAGQDIEYEVDRIISHTDSLNWVLEKLGSLLRPPKPDKPPDYHGYVPATFPEIEYMTLEAWHERRRSPVRAQVNAIEVLLEELDSGASPHRRFRRNPKVSSEEEASSDTTQRTAPMHPALPPRIRINSLRIERLLRSACNDNMTTTDDMTLVLDRPFKVLFLFDEPIREKLQELRSLLITRQEFFDKNPDTRTPSDLESRKFPKRGIFATGTDWQSLTLQELKQASDEFACLVQFMDKFCKPVSPEQYPTELPFVDLWRLFMSEDYIYVKNRPQKVWRLLQATGGRRYLSAPPDTVDQGQYPRSLKGSYSDFVVDAYYLDYDGTAIIPVFGNFSIERGDEDVQLRNLPYLPLQIAQKEGLIDIDATRARGDLFLEYCAPQHRHYNGLTLSRKASGPDLLRAIPGDVLMQRVFSERIDSQVIVDFERAIHANPDWNTSGSELNITKASEHETLEYPDYPESDVRWDKSFSDEQLDEQSKLWRSWEAGKGKPDGDNLLLLPDQVYGYVLRNRNWACLQIGTTGTTLGRLQRIQIRDDSPWQDLEIPIEHKHIVQSLISTHFSADHAADGRFDLVKDKGKGVVVLLHGVPGVGKTATAECVAEAERRPLLPITCGDLGLKPKEVEATLQTAFQLAQAWNCVMLLDEADIFLAQRNNHDIERNALVSVFLRVLEYYEGILFLTTNRVGAFDEAFKSRIHMALYYPPLDLNQTRKIWSAHIRRGRKRKVKVDCNELQLLSFADTLFWKQLDKLLNIGPVWNGRQIRNAFQSAVALARNQNATVSPDTIIIEVRHFQQVADVSNHFNKYIFDTKKGRTDADLARQQFMREDNYAGLPSQQNHTSQHPSGAFPASSVVRQATPLNPSGFPAPAFGPAYNFSQAGFGQPHVNPLFQTQTPGVVHAGYQQYAQGAVQPQAQQQMYQVQQPQQQMNYQQSGSVPQQQMHGQPVNYQIATQIQPDQSQQQPQQQQQQQQGQNANISYGGGGVQSSLPQSSMSPSQLQSRGSFVVQAGV